MGANVDKKEGKSWISSKPREGSCTMASTAASTSADASSSASTSMKNWPTRQLRGHRDKIYSLDWSCDGRRLATGSADKTLRIWTPERTDYGKSTELRGHAGAVNQLNWDPQNPERLVTASSDSSVRFWDIRQGKATHVVQTTEPTLNMAMSPDGKTVAVSDKRDVITFIDAGSGKIIDDMSGKLPEPKGQEVNGFKFNNSGDFIFVPMGDGTLHTYEVPSLEAYHKVFAHPAPCFCVGVDPRGRYIAVGSTDSLVSLWDLQDWYCVRTFSRLEAPVRCVDFSPDGEYIASGGEDLNVDISNVETGKTEHTISLPASCNDLAWHPRSNYLAIACNELQGTVRVFGL